jgi:hypothetical protein
VVLISIATIIAVVVPSILVKTRTSIAIMEVTLVCRLMILVSMVLPLPIFRLLHLVL